MYAGDFHNRHQGETCLIVGVGPNLELTPPAWFDYPSFSVNSIFMHQTWKPTYYVGVDRRLWVENTAKIMAALPEIPKFIPSPDYDDMVDGPNLVRFQHFTSSHYGIGGQLPTHKDALTKRGITYQRVMGAVFQIAYYMGFSRMLLIGLSHKPDDARAHFYGQDTGCIVDQPVEHWFNEYRHWANHSDKVEVLNISKDTYVPESIIPRGNYKDWINGNH